MSKIRDFLLPATGDMFPLTYGIGSVQGSIGLGSGPSEAWMDSKGFDLGRTKIWAGHVMDNDMKMNLDLSMVL